MRLSGGEWSRNNNSYYGRLEVWISRNNQISSSEYDHWATVCEDGFNEHALMLACLNIGLVANPKVSILMLISSVHVLIKQKLSYYY